MPQKYVRVSGGDTYALSVIVRSDPEDRVWWVNKLKKKFTPLGLKLARRIVGYFSLR